MKDRTQYVAVLVVGDPMQATTHIDLQLRAESVDIPVHVVHGISITTLVPGATGVSNYKFGRSTTLTYPYGEWIATSPLEVMMQNYSQKLHTLVLFDLDPSGAGRATNCRCNLLMPLKASQRWSLSTRKRNSLRNKPTRLEKSTTSKSCFAVI